MFENEARVLVILPGELVDRARRLAGQATISMKLPVSLQIVVRALLEEGLRRPADTALLANVKRQAEIVRRIRSHARRPRAEPIGLAPRPRPPGRHPGPAGRMGAGRRAPESR
jgi:hypothetical protein